MKNPVKRKRTTTKVKERDQKITPKRAEPMDEIDQDDESTTNDNKEHHYDHNARKENRNEQDENEESYEKEE
jgi:hypothetical protein